MLRKLITLAALLVALLFASTTGAAADPYPPQVPTETSTGAPAPVADPGQVVESLPSTGGPELLWLLLGAGLVVAGASSVAYSRRRSTALA